MWHKKAPPLAGLFASWLPSLQGVPGAGAGGDGDGEPDGVVAGDGEGGRGLGVAVAKSDLFVEAGVVDGDGEGFGDGGAEGVVEHQQTFLRQGVIDVEKAIPVGAVGAAEVDDIAMRLILPRRTVLGAADAAIGRDAAVCHFCPA